MSYRTIRFAFASALLLPALASPARASSITTYGIIITAMGNELQVQYVDKPASDGSATTDTSSCPVGGGGGGDSSSSLLVTPNGSGGINVTPYGGSTNSGTSSSTGSSDSVSPPGSGSGGGGGGGSSDTVKVPVPVNDGTPPKVDFTNPTTTDVTLPKGASGDQGIETVSVPVPVATAKTPEPASVTLLAIAGLGGMGYVRRRRV
jgi:hypothetical protein